MNALSELCHAIVNARGVLLTTHCSPDGDGIGSQLALYAALKSAGIAVRMHNRDGVPRIYRFLEGSGDVSMGSHASLDDIDLIISLDAGSRARLGFDDAFFAGRRLAVVDHHASNQRFGDLNLIDTSACATGALAYEMIRELDIPLSPASASALYVTLLTDTSSFRNASSTPEVHEMAASLIRAGAEPWPIARAVYEDRSRSSFDLQMRCMQSLEIKHQGRSAWMFVSDEMYRETGGDGEDTEGLIDLGRALSGVLIAVFMRPGDDDSEWKVTFRGKFDTDVGALAASLGGGGHFHAAGCTLQGDFIAIRSRVEALIGEILD